MPLATMIKREVVIFYRTDTESIDEAGNKVADEDAIETLAELQPKRTTEDDEHPDIAESDWTAWLMPEDAEFVNSASSIWAPGLGSFEIVGRPPTWTGGIALGDFVEVNLKQIAGPEDDLGS